MIYLGLSKIEQLNLSVIDPNSFKTSLVCKIGFHNKIDKFLDLLNNEIDETFKPITVVIYMDNIEKYCENNFFKELNSALILKEQNEKILNNKKDINLIIISRFWPQKISKTKFVINIPPFSYEECFNLFHGLFQLEKINNKLIEKLVQQIHELTAGILWLIIRMYDRYIYERINGNIKSPCDIIYSILSDYEKIFFDENEVLISPLKNAQYYLHRQQEKKAIDYEKELESISKIKNQQTKDEIEDLGKINILKLLGMVTPQKITGHSTYNKLNISYIFIVYNKEIINLIRTDL